MELRLRDVMAMASPFWLGLWLGGVAGFPDSPLRAFLAFLAGLLLAVLAWSVVKWRRRDA